MTRVLRLTRRGNSQQIRTAEEAAGMLHTGHGSFAGLGQRMKEIVGALEAELKAPVQDETGLSGYFDFAAYSANTERTAVMDWVHQLGWELTEVERPIEVLVVRRAR